MKPVVVGQADVNSETGVLVTWFAPDGEPVSVGDPVAEVETSKAILDVEAPAAGLLRHAVPQGTEVRLTEPIAHVFADQEELEAFVAGERQAEVGEGGRDAPQASSKAIARAEELGVDLASLSAEGLITVADVEAAAAGDPVELPRLLPGTPGCERVLLFGSGLGATQVLDIFATAGGQEAVGILDDDRSRWGADVDGVPVVGGLDRLAELHAAGGFDTALCAISSPGGRVRLHDACTRHAVPMTNAVDPTAKIARGVVMGTGNVICAFCQLGVDVRIGDGNFLSAYTSLDHHSAMGDDCATGPGCQTSGLVRIGSRVRFGTGIFVEPKVELGDDVQIASGAVVLRSVPAGHAVKTKVVTTAVVPQRG